MTLHDAIDELQRVGSIRAENGKPKLRFSEPQRESLTAAIEVVRRNRDAALQALTSADPRV